MSENGKVAILRYKSSSSATIYETTVWDSGLLSCTCPGWCKRAVRECKHTKALAPFASSLINRWPDAIQIAILQTGAMGGWYTGDPPPAPPRITTQTWANASPPPDFTDREETPPAPPPRKKGTFVNPFSQEQTRVFLEEEEKGE